MAKMKDSGVKWIGEIPEDYNIIHLKYVCSFKTGGTPNNKEGIDVDGDYPWITASDFTNRLTIGSCEQYISRETVKKYGYSLFPTGSILLVCIASVGKVGIILEPSYSNQQITAIKPNRDKIFTQYLLYVIKAGSDQINYDASSNVVPIVNTKYLMNFNIPIIELNTQEQIASFLDKKCSEIDSLYSEIEEQIKVLEEYKKSVITEAVTKGLNPNVEMKDSGIDWIGEIPKEWEIIKIGHIFSLRNERNSLPEDKVQLLSLFSGIGVFPQGEYTTNSGNHAQTVEGYKIVYKNDIVVNIILAWMGAIGVSDYNGVTSPAYDIYIPNLKKVVPHFYHYVFRTSGIAGECYKYGRGIMMMRWRTYSQEFKQIMVPVPSLDEQQQIADYLDSKCAEIDSTIADKQHQLSILEQYKKSLIYEYVTGKKEVPA